MTGPSASAAPGPRTERTRITRHPERAVPERVEEILAIGLVAHVAYVAAGEPRVIPFLYGYEAGRLILHGDPASPTLTAIGSGLPVAVCVTITGGLVPAATAAGHAIDYRSVVAYGTAERVADLAEKRRLLEALTSRYFPGRLAGRDYAPASEEELARLEVVAIAIEEATAKARPAGIVDGATRG